MTPKLSLKPRCAWVLIVILSGLAFARSSAATRMFFTLTAITFNDGSTASGFFTFNSTNQIYGAFNIITSNSKSYTGSIYSPGMGTGTNFLSSPDAFIFDNFLVDSHYLVWPFRDTLWIPEFMRLNRGWQV